MDELFPFACGGVILPYYITDRNASHVSRLKYLREKGWANMTAEERDEWNGVVGQNLFDQTVFGSGNNNISVSTSNDKITITALVDISTSVRRGIECDPFDYNLYIDGNNRLTIGVDTITAPAGSVCDIRLSRYKYNWTDIVSEYYSPSLQPGSYVTYTIDTSKGGHKLSIFVGGLSAGQSVVIRGFRINRGARVYPYVPHGALGVTDAIRGAYNYTDFNRVESAVSYLSSFAGLNLTTKTNWSANDIMSIDEFENRYIANVNAVCSALGVPGVSAKFSRFDFNAANNIEKALQAAEDTL